MTVGTDDSGAARYVIRLDPGPRTHVTEVVLEALQKIIGQFNDKELVFRVVRKALESVRSQRRVSLRVQPGQVDALKTRLDEILREFPGLDCIDVIGDSRLQPGDCLMESEMGVVDASVDRQLDAICRALRRQFKG